MNLTKSAFWIKNLASKTLFQNQVASSHILSACAQCFHNQGGSRPKDVYIQNQCQWYHNSMDHNRSSRFQATSFLWPKNHNVQTFQMSYSCVKLRISLSKKELLKINGPDVLSHRQLMASPKAILDASPKTMQPYLRLIRFDKPIGTWLLYWPCTWSIGLAAVPGHLPDFRLLALFGAGSFFMRGAGCIINDMWDRDYDKRIYQRYIQNVIDNLHQRFPDTSLLDAFSVFDPDLINKTDPGWNEFIQHEMLKVERTKLRPLASGELNMFQGLCCLGGMLSISLMILLQLNWYSVALGAASMFLVVTYPLAKRVTFWPQAMLAITFNYGTMLGWAAVNAGVDWSIVLPLYISCMAWTMAYDTIYAHQDKYDDMLIGVKSTALKFGDQTKLWLTGFSAIMISGLTYTGIACDQTWPYFCGLGITAAHIAHQLYTVDLNNADDCAAKFRSNTGLGLVMFTGIVFGTLLKGQKSDTKKVDEGS